MAFAKSADLCHHTWNPSVTVFATRLSIRMDGTLIAHTGPWLACACRQAQVIAALGQNFPIIRTCAKRGFKCFYLLGEMIQFDSYFSKMGLVPPPVAEWDSLGNAQNVLGWEIHVSPPFQNLSFADIQQKTLSRGASWKRCVGYLCTGYMHQKRIVVYIYIFVYIYT